MLNYETQVSAQKYSTQMYAATNLGDAYGKDPIFHSCNLKLGQYSALAIMRKLLEVIQK